MNDERVPTPERSWLFKSKSRSDDNSTAQLWRWHVRSADGESASSQMFGTLAACVRDAQQHGFSGKVDATAGSFATGGYEIKVAADVPTPARSMPLDRTQ